MQRTNNGTLYICGTPVGNLDDITIRALGALKKSDIIACEDTRRTGKLLSHYGITPRTLISYHLHSKPGREEKIINYILEGRNVILVSDAGMPGISDPGFRLVKKAVDNNISLTVLPGVSAITSALAVSGFYADRFVFLGFIDRLSKKERSELLNRYGDGETLVIFVSPYKLLSTLKELQDIYGDCLITIARELTKKFEEIRRGSVEEQIDFFSENEPRGEFTLVVKPEKRCQDQLIDDHLLKENMQKLEAAGLKPKEALKAVSVLRDVPRNRLYKLQLEQSDK